MARCAGAAPSRTGLGQPGRPEQRRSRGAHPPGRAAHLHTLDELARRIRTLVNQRIARQVVARLSLKEQDRLLDLSRRLVPFVLR